ncbi:MAG: PstS family phosphate ABC transporter substrate-binding protein [Planctomycetota bacterium]
MSTKPYPFARLSVSFRFLLAWAWAGAFGLTTGAVTVPALAQPGGEVRVDGSSTVYPITAVASEQFGHESDAHVAVNQSGTGSGMRMFVRGEIDIAGASRPIKPLEHAACAAGGIGYVEIPIAYDGLTIAVNKNNHWARALTIDQVRKVFLKPGAQTWADVDPTFPATPITCYTPGEVSGTYDYFLEVVAGKIDKQTGRHEHGELRDDLSRSEDDNLLVNGVAGNPGGIGFFGAAYYFANQDKVESVAIQNPINGDFVRPRPETIETNAYAPFSRPLFLYVRVDALDKPEVAEFLSFYVDEAALLAEAVGYVGLPESVYDVARRKIAQRETGSVYLSPEGESVKGPVTALYR